MKWTWAFFTLDFLRGKHWSNKYARNILVSCGKVIPDIFQVLGCTCLWMSACLSHNDTILINEHRDYLCTNMSRLTCHLRSAIAFFTTRTLIIFSTHFLSYGHGLRQIYPPDPSAKCLADLRLHFRHMRRGELRIERAKMPAEINFEWVVINNWGGDRAQSSYEIVLHDEV